MSTQVTWANLSAVKCKMSRITYNGPPERFGYALEVSVLFGDLGEVNGRAEQDHADDKEEHEQAELLHGGVQRLAEDLQTLEVPAQLEYPEDAHEANDAQESERHGLARLALLVGKYGAERDEVGYDGHNVDDVHDALEEHELERTRNEPDDELEREPHDAYGLDDEERLGELWQVVLDDLECFVSLSVEVVDAIALEVGHRLQAEDDNAGQYDRDGQDGHDARARRRLRILEEQPDLALQLVGWQDAFFFFR